MKMASRKSPSQYVKTTHQNQLDLGGRALLAARLAAISYKTEKSASTACKKLGFPWVKLISKDGAECLVVKDRNDMWLAFRGTEPSKMNDVMADLKIIRNSAKAGGKVHSGFQEEVNDLWMDVLSELEHNDSLKIRKDVYMTGHSLGAAMATIAATRYNPLELFTFGSPRVGGARFTRNIKCRHLRFQNNNDIVTRVPPVALGFRHHGELCYVNSLNERQPRPLWKNLFLGVWRSWRQLKFFDGISDHSMPGYVKVVAALVKQEKIQ